MPTGKQVKAARMLLDWTAEDLAEQSNVTSETIFRIERGTTNPKPETIERVINALRVGGVEFEGERGVRIILEDYRVFEGEDCYLRLLDEVYLTMRNKEEAEVLSICTDDSVSSLEVTHAIQRWHDVGIKCRFLTHEKAKRFDFPLEEYRLIPTKFFRNSVMVVYEDKVAILRGTNDAVIIVRDQDHADMLKGLFEMIWLKSEEVSE